MQNDESLKGTLDNLVNMFENSSIDASRSLKELKEIDPNNPMIGVLENCVKNINTEGTVTDKINLLQDLDRELKKINSAS